VVAVSFSFAYPARDIIPVLQHLRRLLPANMELWAGGRGLASLKKSPRGVVIIRDLSDAVEKAKAMSPSDAHEIDHGR
jgi:hypothetical protein